MSPFRSDWTSTELQGSKLGGGVLVCLKPPGLRQPPLSLPSVASPGEIPINGGYPRGQTIERQSLPFIGGRLGVTGFPFQPLSSPDNMSERQTEDVDASAWTSDV